MSVGAEARQGVGKELAARQVPLIAVYLSLSVAIMSTSGKYLVRWLGAPARPW